MTPAIEFEKVTAGYRDTVIVDNVSLSIPEGEMAGIIGPNGAGKTTLLRVITGLIKPCAGSVRLFGRPIAELGASERARLVGVVPATMETPMAFTVEEIVMTGRVRLMSRWRPPAAEDRRAADRAMAYTAVSDLKHRAYSALSAGEKQRVVIAMVLAQQPRLILMDEATSHLDINHRLEVMSIVERLNREQRATVLMVSHDLNLSADYCRKLLLMNHGALVAQGTPREVLTEATLREVYHCDVHVQANQATGSVTVTPARRWMPDRSGEGLRVHVIGGGGCAGEILRWLSLCGYTVTCGVLNAGDTDTELATALGMEVALEKPFSPVGPVALAAARALIAKADAVIVAGVPFGPGNVANLELAAEAGKPVLMMRGVEARDYTPDRAAARLAQRLLETGAVQWENTADLFPRLPSKPVENRAT